MYRAGWGREEIRIPPQGHAMQGYGMWHHRARGQQSPLHARALYLEDSKGTALVFCCLDLGYVTHAMREGACVALRERMGEAFREDALVLTCTHTHSGPGGCAHEAMYNIVTPGFVPAHVKRIVDAIVAAVTTAWQSAAPTALGLVAGRFDDHTPVAWNRSLRARNRNPEVTPLAPDAAHLALDRGMSLLSFRREGRLHSLLSLFGVHATCVGSGQKQFDGDNKGYAALQAEKALQLDGVAGAVAIFAQATAGDVSPHYHGPGDVARRRRLQGAAEYAYAEQNGRHQSELALSLLETAMETPVTGDIDVIFGYADFTAIKADPAFANGERDARTSEPCHGVAFFAGTRVDGPGMPAPLARVTAVLAAQLKQRRLVHGSAEERAYYHQLYASQGPKAVLMESGRKQVLGRPLDSALLPGFADPLLGEMKRQARSGALHDSPLVPTVLPLQIVVIGQVALVCCPGEFTTTAGARLRQTVQERLAARGVTQVLICTYCNDYMGYVTTFEEYQEQAYEGGHTIFGQWTLAAFQTRFAALADELRRPEAERGHDRRTRPPAVPEAELALRSNLPVPR